MRGVRSIMKRSLLGLFLAQLSVIAGLMGVDALRKRRTKRRTIPRSAPADQQVGESTTTTYTFGEDLYAEMLAAIDGARDRVYLETYIWKGDEVGRRFKEAVIAAARRGVDVHVIYDGFANLVVPRSFFTFPPEVHVLRFPVFRARQLLLSVRHSGRDHRKILTVDGEVGFVGGYNIGTVYATQWRDTHLKISGPSAHDLEDAFVDFWNLHRGRDQPALRDDGAGHWEPRIRIARNIPAQLVYPIRGLYLGAIDRARHHVYITQAYFIPDREILQALLAAAARGVDVRVVVPEVSNHVVADWLSRGLYTTLLRGGVTIWLYQGMVHAKTATIDGHWTTIGTANIDRLSLTGNYEINVEVFSDDLAKQMEAVFEHDLTNCRPLSLAEWERRHVVARFSEAVLAPLRPLI